MGSPLSHPALPDPIPLVPVLLDQAQQIVWDRLGRDSVVGLVQFATEPQVKGAALLLKWLSVRQQFILRRGYSLGGSSSRSGRIGGHGTALLAASAQERMARANRPYEIAFECTNSNPNT
jgi:hypothetical protein